MKVGWANDSMQRASDGFWQNSHPKELCDLLCPPHFQLLGLWEGTQEEEKALHEQWNGSETLLRWTAVLLQALSQDF